MRHFTIRPPLTLRGRKFKGLRGWAGKPLHPPLTNVETSGDHPVWHKSEQDVLPGQH